MSEFKCLVRFTGDHIYHNLTVITGETLCAHFSYILFNFQFPRDLYEISNFAILD